MEPAVNSVVDVFMERRAEFLPRLMRIAEIMADCASVTLSDTTSDTLAQACDNSHPWDTERAAIRFRATSNEIVAEVSSLDTLPKVDFCLTRQ